MVPYLPEGCLFKKHGNSVQQICHGFENFEVWEACGFVVLNRLHVVLGKAMSEGTSLSSNGVKRANYISKDVATALPDVVMLSCYCLFGMLFEVIWLSFRGR